MSNGWGAQSEAPATEAWGTGDLASALPEVSHDGFGNGNEAENGHEDGNGEGASNIVPVVQVVPEALKGWVRPTAYDYTGEAPREWEGNAAVYEWDGETGDIGPEYPELELQLFGNPAELTSSHGIDFSK
jgi:ATP-dependent RNA helicase DDX3X